MRRDRRLLEAAGFTWWGIAGIVWMIALTTLRATSMAPSVVAHVARVPVAAALVTVQSTPAAPPTFVGADTCLACHDTMKEGYVNTPHGRSTSDPRSPAARQGCESCHGPGSAHAEDPVNVKPVRPDALVPAESNAVCTTCHNRGEHALWEGSQHEARGVSCTTCHSVHAYKSETKQLKQRTQRELCASCHRDKIAKLDRSGHMPVREGKLQCTTCHNAHGTTNVRLLRKGDSVAELCNSCHADKRGPFLWEHAPARDGCVTCHDPHGSTNERMLVSKPPLLCQRCHVATRHPSTIYDAALMGTSVRVYGRTCVMCHSAIHGSNHPSGQRFIR